MARRGHTEAATGESTSTLNLLAISTSRTRTDGSQPLCSAYTDLCKLTSLPAVGLLCEIVKPDDPLGSMARRDDCKAFAEKWGFKMISIDQLQQFMEKKQGGQKA